MKPSPTKKRREEDTVGEASNRPRMSSEITPVVSSSRRSSTWGDYVQHDRYKPNYSSSEAERRARNEEMFSRRSEIMPPRSTYVSKEWHPCTRSPKSGDASYRDRRPRSRSPKCYHHDRERRTSSHSPRKSGHNRERRSRTRSPTEAHHDSEPRQINRLQQERSTQEELQPSSAITKKKVG